MEINYRNVRNATSHKWYERALAEHLCMSLSPFISIWFIKKHIKPNTITVLMVLTGIIAPLLLMVDNFTVRCIASFMFLLWFILDSSDGEVARFTSTFSKHGRDLDYLSHISCHSLFVVAMWKIYVYPSDYLYELTILFFLLLASELYYRMSVVYSVYVFKPTSEPLESSHKLIQNILLNLTYFPNFVVFFPLLICTALYFDINILPFFVVIFSLYFLVKLKSFILMVIRFYSL